MLIINLKNDFKKKNKNFKLKAVTYIQGVQKLFPQFSKLVNYVTLFRDKILNMETLFEPIIYIYIYYDES